MFKYFMGPGPETPEERSKRNKARRKKVKKRKKRVEQRIEARNNPGWIRAFFQELPPFGEWPRKYYLTIIIVFLMAARMINLGSSSETVTLNKSAKLVSDTGKEVYEEKTITLGSTGCMLMHSPILDEAEQEEGIYSFESVYQYITPLYSAPDYMTCEFEGSICTDDYEYSGHPLFRCPESFAFAIRNSGVDMQMLATNHIYDGMAEGVTRTAGFFRDNGIDYTGVRADENDKRYTIKSIQGVQVGFFDYTYETEGTGMNINAIPVDDSVSGLINTFDPANPVPFYQEVEGVIKEMRDEGAQFIVGNLHWGTEYQLEPNDFQKELAQRLCDLGVDALIGGHPHCEQPIDVLTSSDGSKNMFCIYSEGNALSNQRQELMEEDMPGGYTEDGVIITLTLHQDTEGSVAITGVNAIPTWVCKIIDEESGSREFYILPLDNVEQIESSTGLGGIYDQAKASYERTMAVIGEGLAKAQTVFGTDAGNLSRETGAEEEAAAGSDAGGVSGSDVISGAPAIDVNAQDENTGEGISDEASYPDGGDAGNESEAPYGTEAEDYGSYENDYEEDNGEASY